MCATELCASLEFVGGILSLQKVIRMCQIGWKRRANRNARLEWQMFTLSSDFPPICKLSYSCSSALRQANGQSWSPGNKQTSKVSIQDERTQKISKCLANWVRRWTIAQTTNIWLFDSTHLWALASFVSFVSFVGISNKAIIKSKKTKVFQTSWLKLASFGYCCGDFCFCVARTNSCKSVYKLVFGVAKQALLLCAKEVNLDSSCVNGQGKVTLNAHGSGIKQSFLMIYWHLEV